MASAETPGAQMLANGRRQVEQAERIGDVAARFADRARQAFLIEAELVNEAGKAFRFLNRVQILALQVFD
jgi:hypothetical protein